MSRRALALALLLLAGCGGGAGAPPERGRDPAERRGADSGDVAFWEEMADRAVRELASKVSARGAGRPVVRIMSLENRTRQQLDMEGLRGRIASSLEASGRFELAARGSWAAGDEAPDMVPEGEAASLRLSGSLSETVQQDADGTRADYTLTLQLTNSRDGGLAAMSRQKSSRITPTGRGE